MKHFFRQCRAAVATTLLCGLVLAAPSVVPPAPAATKPSAITTGRPEPVPIAFVYRDSIVDSAWTRSHELARKAIEAEFGSRISTVAVERVASASDADRVFRDLAARGYKVIFATDLVHSDAALNVATADYEIKVEQAMGTRTLLNVRVYEIRHFEQAYLAGIIAAGSSTSRKLGFVASRASPNVMLEINAFALGAQSVNKAISTQVVWVGSQSSPDADTRAAETLIKRGVDVLIATTDSGAVVEAAEREQQRRARRKNSRPTIGVIGWHVDQSALAPHAHLASLVLDWTPFYNVAVKESFNYLCTKSDTSRGYREGAIRVVGLSNSVSRAAKARLDAVQSQLSAGDFDIFAGPLRTNSGAAIPPRAGFSGGDQAWRQSMNYLLRGVSVDGSVEVNAADRR